MAAFRGEYLIILQGLATDFEVAGTITDGRGSVWSGAVLGHTPLP